MTLTTFLRKAQTGAMLMRKNTGNVGRILTKASQFGTKVLDAAADVGGPLVTMNPAYMAARTAVNVAGIAGKAGTEIGGAKSLQGVGRSLGDAYGATSRLAASTPAPGAETLETAAG